ncbi:MAG: hypothetical protein ACP5EK_00460 [Thermoplasmatota archaeon]
MSRWFERLARGADRYFSWLTGDQRAFRRRAQEGVSPEFREALNFTGLEVEPHQVLLLSYAGALLALATALVLDAAVLALYGFSPGDMGALTVVLLVGITLGLPLAALQVLSEYPKTRARSMRIHSLGDIPEVLSYVVMYLKLIPNLEDGLRFAARESHTSLGRDLRKLLWDLEVRVYRGIDDAVTTFARRWKAWSGHLQRALHLVRSAVREESEGQRIQTLDRSLDVVMDGTRNSMSSFARRLHQPTLVIYAIGVMVPLALIAMLPAASLVGLRLSVIQICLLYNILLPLGLGLYMRRVLLRRPATFSPPAIPPHHPGVAGVDRRLNALVAALAGVILAFPGAAMLAMPRATLDLWLLDSLPPTLFLLWGITAAVALYCRRTYAAYSRVRDRVRSMEEEFGDSLYVIGKRIGEGKPAEEAFHHAGRTLAGSEMGEVFAHTSFNLVSLRTDLRGALFDDTYGSLQHVHSDRIRAVMGLLAEGVKKSHRAAGRAIVKIADHLKQLQDVERGIKNSLGTLTSSLQSTATVFAPLIAGVTLGITELIATVLGGTETGSPPDAAVLSGAGHFSYDVQPHWFVLVVGVYLLQLVFLLVRFANGIDEGDDRVAYLHRLGQALPTAVVFFSLVTVLSMVLFRGMAPG